MGLRLHRVTDDEWLRLAASRRSHDLAGLPPRTSIGAIEIEMRTLERSQPQVAPADEYPEAATG